MAARRSAPTQAPDGAVAAAPATLTVDLDALAFNWRTLRERAGPAECAAAVKADAYGIGLEPAVRALRRAGCRTFFVAHLGEAERLLRVAPDATAYVLNGLLPGAAAATIALGARPVLGSGPELEEWAAACRAAGRRLPAALHVDTGMNRLGFPVDEARRLPGDPLLADFAPALVMSHLTSAEEPDDPGTARQIALFDEIRAGWPGVPASLSNGAGLFLATPPRHDLVRPGYALYGGNPVPGRPNPMRPVARLEAQVVQTRAVAAGDSVGYGRGWTAKGPRRLATLPVGYADGYPRAASASDAGRREGEPGGAALIAGRLCPFAGRVSMDLIVVDVTELPPELCGRGTVATLIGDELDIDEVGRRAGTIGYEVLTRLGRRFDRRYLGG